MFKIRKRYVNDLLIYFQKNYDLYCVEFRETIGGCTEIVLIGTDENRWWISIIVHMFTASVFIAIAGKDNCYNECVSNDILKGRYIGYGKKYCGNYNKRFQ